MEKTSRERLEELRRSGRLDDGEYQRLSEALDTREEAPTAHRHVPWPIWVLIGFLALSAASNLAQVPAKPMAITWVAVQCSFIYGLKRLHQWAFVVVVIATAAHIGYFVAHGPLTMAFINVFLLALLARCFRQFFPRAREAGAHE